MTPCIPGASFPVEGPPSPQGDDDGKQQEDFYRGLNGHNAVHSRSRLGGGPHMADQQKSTPQQTAADNDFGKLSADGSRAFEDLTLTRLAIYDGRIADAKKYVNEADTAFGKAKTDEAVFTKAQADLKMPTSKDASANKNVSGAAPMTKVEGEKILARRMECPPKWQIRKSRSHGCRSMGRSQSTKIIPPILPRLRLSPMRTKASRAVIAKARWKS